MLRKIIIIFIAILISGCSGAKSKDYTKPEDQSPQIQEITYFSVNSYQPALFYAPKSTYKKPLLVALHPWSNDYLYKKDVPYSEWCVKNNWAFIYPNFRGPNNNPDATGSDLVIQDIINAVNYAKDQTNIDVNRIYLVGASGGGYTSLMVTSKYPEIWAGVSVWCSITDLKNWYYESLSTYPQYSNDIINSCSGIPNPGTMAETECLKRSPITYLAEIKNQVNIDINAGINDGHTGPVLISHSINAFNLLAQETDQLSQDQINYIVDNISIPDDLNDNYYDSNYSKPVLFRRQSQKARLTIFDGGHEILYKAALNWLSKQRKN